ncbi:MAG: hypothetical protein BGP24_12535 [Lysobacterales bacterium 69-70]|nr:DUF4124 domain-containing protein [Xanthomonadaceae bacterium]ODU31023.1 MAG: hypothetical protein ABS97_22295 [Xanthomonadaceae bacterium SCN 69-320]ODV20813.1 MAG: hypothetical protein ABT27_06395 [Xanthomonadaceae bacterium SCN 69-25]OJY98611.1 MAG: hypothetical protein BGP24_12535 [Xanthomonadales bacterium 69-70]
MPDRLSLLSLPSLLLLLITHALPAPALTIHRCTDRDGAVAFQDRPCAAHLQAREVVLRAEPTATSAPAENRGEPAPGSAPTKSRRNGAAATRPAPRTRSRRPSPAVEAVATSWECRAGNGEVFYQHGPCPAAVIGDTGQRAAATRGRRRAGVQTVPVAGRPIARAEACRRIHAASASDRAGHERDEDVTTYERNLGRDPCR